MAQFSYESTITCISVTTDTDHTTCQTNQTLTAWQDTNKLEVCDSHSLGLEEADSVTCDEDHDEDHEEETGETTRPTPSLCCQPRSRCRCRPICRTCPSTCCRSRLA